MTSDDNSIQKFNKSNISISGSGEIQDTVSLMETRLTTQRSAPELKKRTQRILEDIIRLPFSRSHFPSCHQLQRQLDGRTLDKSIKQLVKNNVSQRSRSLFSLYKYKVRGQFNSCMHIYKSELSPVRESFVNY